MHGRGGQNNEATKYVESQKPKKEKKKKKLEKGGVKDSNKVDREKEERRHKTEGAGLQK